jgi:predicted RNA binding protein YcfA (HicA-like mRNA interferase family)
MREKLPRIPAKKIITLLEKKGFNLVRQSGSHKIARKSRGDFHTIPL